MNPIEAGYAKNEPTHDHPWIWYAGVVITKDGKLHRYIRKNGRLQKVTPDLHDNNKPQPHQDTSHD